MSDELSPDRPWERESDSAAGAAGSTPATPAPPPARSGFSGLGCFAIIAVVLVVIVIAFNQIGKATQGPCDVAREAYVLATTLDNAHDREIAALQYAVKKAECEAQGGSVG